MTKLTTTVTLNANCLATVTDSTGFYNSATNPNGFLPESDTSSPVLDTYKLSQGSFINVLVYNDYNKIPYVVISEIATPVTTSPYTQFVPSYKLAKDGNYSLYRFFFPSKTYYTANSLLYGDRQVYYVNNGVLYTIIDGVEALANYKTLIDTYLNSFTGLYSQSDFLSICQLNLCRFKLNEQFVHQQIEGKVDSHLPALVDLLNISFNVIDYLTETQNYTQIQRILKDLTVCGGICERYLKSRSISCGCYEN